MEEEVYEAIREQFCLRHTYIASGKMMSSEAITYKDKVFTFYSRKKRMVFKLGTVFDRGQVDMEIAVFSPFKNRAPLRGWFEVPFDEKVLWIVMTEKALDHIKHKKHI